MVKEDIINALKHVEHPAKGDRNIVDLGMVDSVTIGDDGSVEVVLAFSKHRDPLAEYLIQSTRSVLVGIGAKDAKVTTKIKEEAPKQKTVQDLGTSLLQGVKHIIGVASGKGGVGKSTVAVNLAIALAEKGYKVGLADADVYGPSIPKMTGTEGAQPMAEEIDNQDIIIPFEKFGVKWMSIGYFAAPEQALIWRGPMACNALKQMILQVKWGELDVLLIDMPPGTGDIHISLIGDVPMEGAIIVTTPGDVALADVEKGINMFMNPKVGKTVFGIVENMSWFTPRELPDSKYFIFGRGGGEAIAAKYGLPLLGQIPLVQGICESSDHGHPAALENGPDSEAFKQLADKISKIFE